MKSLIVTVCCTALVSCAAMPKPGNIDRNSVNEVKQATGMIGDDWPAPPNLLSTTDGEIYLGNLNSQITVISSDPRLRQRTTFAMTLAGLLYQRFQIEGRVEDAEMARHVLESVHENPQFRPADHLVYAKVLMGFHDFDAAAEQIDLAETRGASASGINAARNALDRSLRLPANGLGTTTGVSGNYTEAVQQAAALLDRGQLTSASEMLRRAQELYRDSSPFPLAWIHVQQGIAFLRYGEYEQARAFFAAAHQRFPQYFLATEHLAETEGLLGNHARAAELYRQVTAQNNQPGFWHGLAQAEAALGNAQAAEDAAQRAASGYEDLLTRYPLMYADHAVGYYLDVEDPQRALDLAQQNFAHRQDLMAQLALADALLGNGQAGEACARVRAIREAGLAPPEIMLAGEALSDCGSSD